MRTEDQIRADAADRRPFSNGSEWEIWADTHCYECVHDDAEREIYCPILNVSMLGKAGDGSRSAWPTEWGSHFVRFGDTIPGTTRRQPIESTADDPEAYEYVGDCSEFEQRRDPGDDPDPEPEPPPVCDGQLDIIDAYLPTAIAELSREPARADR